MTRYVLARLPSNRGEDTVVLGLTSPVASHRNRHRVGGYVAQRGERTVYLPPAAAILAKIVLTARQISYQTAAEALYSDRDDGGPLTMDDTLRLIMWRMKCLLATIDVHLDPWWGNGYRLRDG